MVSKYFRVKDAATMAGTTVATIKNWERLGKLDPPARNAANQRLYSAEQVADLVRMNVHTSDPVA